MTVRVEILPDEVFEIMRMREGRKPKRYYGANLDTAMCQIKFLLKNDLAQARSERFTPQAVKEAKEAYKQLLEKSPYDAKKR